MSLVEKEITTSNVERARKHPNLLNLHEIESKLDVIRPEAFERYRASAVPMEQIYLSTPTDEFSIRIRKELASGVFKLTGTLKDRGEVVDGMLDRLEISAKNISDEAFDYYASNPQFASLNQSRAHITNDMTIDFIEGRALPVIEIETKDMHRRDALMKELQGLVVDRTGDTAMNKEQMAYDLLEIEYEATPESLDAFSDKVVREMVAHYASGKNMVVTGLPGMSGSGKTTVTRAIQEKITEAFGEDYTPIVVSTDDYHFGKKKLEAKYGAPWTQWDDPRTYNTAELARDLHLLKNGASLIKRHFDFANEETVFDEEILPTSPFVIVEGLYAGSKDLEAVRDLHFELPTRIATAIGRDVRRLVIENRANRAFPTPESRLKYQLETALPLYLSQERPLRNSFSASTRLLADRAFMLERLKELG